MEEHADEAVRSGRWRVCGWNEDGSERLAPIWNIAEGTRPNVTTAQKCYESFIESVTKRKRSDEVDANSFGDG